MNDTAGVELPAPKREAIDLKDGVRAALKDRELALHDLLKAIREFRWFTHRPPTLRGSDYAYTVQELHNAIHRAAGLFQ